MFKKIAYFMMFIGAIRSIELLNAMQSEGHSSHDIMDRPTLLHESFDVNDIYSITKHDNDKSLCYSVGFVTAPYFVDAMYYKSGPMAGKHSVTLTRGALGENELLEVRNLPSNQFWIIQKLYNDRHAKA